MARNPKIKVHWSYLSTISVLLSAIHVTGCANIINNCLMVTIFMTLLMLVCDTVCFSQKDFSHCTCLTPSCIGLDMNLHRIDFMIYICIDWIHICMKSMNGTHTDTQTCTINYSLISQWMVLFNYCTVFSKLRFLHIILSNLGMTW